MEPIHEEISSKTINIDFSDVNDEVSDLYQHQANFYSHIKDNMKSKKKKTINYNFTISDSLSSENITQITGYRSKIVEKNNPIYHSIIFLAYDNDDIIYSKEIIIPKTIHLDETVKNFDKIIAKENIIPKLKLLIDRINGLTKTTIINDLKTEQIDELLEDYKIEYEELKNKYKNILKSRTIINSIKNNRIHKNDVQINKLNQYFYYYNSIFLKEYNKLLESSEGTIDYENYTKLSTILGSNTNQIEENNIMFINPETKINDFGTIIEDLKTNIKVIPFLEKSFIIVPKENIINKNIDISINNLKKHINENKYQDELLNFNTVLLKTGSDIIIPKLIIKKYFIGNEIINPNLDEKVTDKIIGIKESSINLDIINNTYSGVYEVSNLYNTKKLSYINIQYDVSSQSIDTIYGDKINIEDTLKKSFIMLNNFSDWRIKLDIFYINKIDINQTIIPIIIDKNKFASVLHYILFYKYYNRPDISGRKFIDYNLFAENLLLNKNGKYANIWGKDLLYIEYQHNLQSHHNWDSIKNNVIRRAHYAKFFQNEDLKNILIMTNQSVLMKKLENSKVLINYELMEVRYLLQNDISPSDFYEDYITDKQLFLKITSDIKTDSKKTPTDITSKLFKFFEKPNDEKETIKSLSVKLSDKITSFNLNISKLPLDNDTLFYSIVHGLFNIKRIPMLFDKENQYSDKVIFKNISLEEDIYKPIFLEASKNLRIELSEFYQKCIDFTDKTNIDLQDITKSLKPEMIQYMASNKDAKIGTVGNLNVIILASAMLNINFNIYTFYEKKHYKINVADAKKIFPNVSKFTDPPVDINLGYLLDTNYILLESKDNVEILWNKKIYYVVDIEHEDKIYKLATSNDATLNIVGIFDDNNKTWGSSGNDDVDDILGELMAEYWNTQSKDPKINKDIKLETYWINTDTNDVIHAKFGLKSIGKLVTEYDDDGSIETDIEFN